jgi:hypothetical protein
MVTNSKNKTPKNKKAIRNKFLNNDISGVSNIYKHIKKLRKEENDKSELLKSQSGGAGHELKLYGNNSISLEDLKNKEVKLKIKFPEILGLLAFPTDTISVTLKGDNLKSNASSADFSCYIISKNTESIPANELPALSLVRTYSDSDKSKSCLYYDDSLLAHFTRTGDSITLDKEPNPFCAKSHSEDDLIFLNYYPRLKN